MADLNNRSDAQAGGNQVMRPVEVAYREVLDWLEQDLKRLDSQNWSMDTLALFSLVSRGDATDYQKDQYNAIVTDRRAAHAVYAILNNARSHFGVTTAASPSPNTTTKGSQNASDAPNQD